MKRYANLLNGAMAIHEDYIKTFANDTPVVLSAVRSNRQTTVNRSGVVNLHGVIMPRSDWFSSGLDEFMNGLRAMASDNTVDQIIIDVYSPGGSTAGLTEAAAEIREIRKIKPVIAVTDALMASAAYWLASQATEVHVLGSADVGSVGVYAVAYDESEALANAGIKVNVIRAGENKAEFDPSTPTSEESLAHLQSRVDADYAMFISDISKGRGISKDKVIKTFGGGRTFKGVDAVAIGMIDGNLTLAEIASRKVKPVENNRLRRNRALWRD